MSAEVLSLLRHTLQFSESQVSTDFWGSWSIPCSPCTEVRFIVDGTRSCPMPPQRRPTAASITEGLHFWGLGTSESCET